MKSVCNAERADHFGNRPLEPCRNLSSCCLHIRTCRLFFQAALHTKVRPRPTMIMQALLTTMMIANGPYKWVSFDHVLKRWVDGAKVVSRLKRPHLACGRFVRTQHSSRNPS